MGTLLAAEVQEHSVFSIMLPILVVDTANNPQFTLAAGVRKVKRSQGQVVDLTADEELFEDSRQQAEEQRRGRHAIWGDDPAAGTRQNVPPHQLLRGKARRPVPAAHDAGASVIAGAISGLGMGLQVDSLASEVSTLRRRVDDYRQMVFKASNPEDQQEAREWLMGAEQDLLRAIQERDEARKPAARVGTSAALGVVAVAAPR
ncbi:hypothetical protein HaLaN_32354, partial [Haematococcus lacustris]